MVGGERASESTAWLATEGCVPAGLLRPMPTCLVVSSRPPPADVDGREPAGTAEAFRLQVPSAGRGAGAVPPEGEGQGRGDEDGAAGGECASGVDPLADDGEAAGEGVEGALELVSVLGAVVGAAGGPGYPFECGSSITRALRPRSNPPRPPPPNWELSHTIRDGFVVPKPMGKTRTQRRTASWAAVCESTPWVLTRLGQAGV